MNTNSACLMLNDSLKKSPQSGLQLEMLCNLLNSTLRILITKIISTHLTNLEIRSLSTYIPYNCQNLKDLAPSSLEDMMDHLRSLSKSAQ